MQHISVNKSIHARFQCEKNIEKEKQKMDELFNEKVIQKEAVDDIRKVMIQLEEKEIQLMGIVKNVRKKAYYTRYIAFGKKH